MDNRRRYYLYKFCNSRHPWILRRLFHGGAFLGCLLCRLSPGIAGELCQPFLDDGFKLGIRNLNWALKLSAVFPQLISDSYYDPSPGLSSAKLVKLYQSVKKSRRFEPLEKEVTLAYLSSAVLESQVAPGGELVLTEAQHPEYDGFFQAHFIRAEALVVEAAANLASARNSIPVKAKKESLRPGENFLGRDAPVVMKALIEELRSHQFPLFAISGTLLGLVREKHFIAHDCDIDLGLMASRYSPGMIKLLEEMPSFKAPVLDFPCFRLLEGGKVVYRRSEIPSMIVLCHNSGVQFDIFNHFSDGGKTVHGARMYWWENDQFELREQDFLDFRLLTPDDTDRYLEETYGEWRTPKKDYDFSTDSGNLVCLEDCKSHIFFLTHPSSVARALAGGKSQERSVPRTIPASSIMGE